MKNGNRIPTVKLRLHLNEVLASHLDLAVKTGLFGHNRQQCAERLVAEGLRRLIKEGVVDSEFLKPEDVA